MPDPLKPAEDISRRVEVIQADTTGAVAAIGEIERVIARISEFQTTLASAVEEQTATTAGVNRSVTEAADGTRDIAGNITAVARTAVVTSQNAGDCQKATTDLDRLSAQLDHVVAGFRYCWAARTTATCMVPVATSSGGRPRLLAR